MSLATPRGRGRHRALRQAGRGLRGSGTCSRSRAPTESVTRSRSRASLHDINAFPARFVGSITGFVSMETAEELG